MIFTDRKITIRNGKSAINEPVILYRGDYEVSIRFTIMESKFRFKSGVNLVDSEKASHGQLAILTPYGGNVFSEIVKCEDGTVTFTLTKEMIDQLEEVGLYSFQIRLFDYYRESRISMPPVEFGIEVREPVASEDQNNEVGDAIVGYSIARYPISKVTDGLNKDVPDTFDDNGNYNKTDWETGDRISEGRLNKIEDAIDKINQNEINDKNFLNKQMTSNFNVLQSQIDNMVIESGSTDAEVEQARGEYSLLNQRLNAMDETDVELVSRLEEANSQLTQNVTIVNGSNDDTLNLKKALLSNTNKILLEKGKVYHINDTLTVKGKEIDLNGATLYFELNERQSGIILDSNSCLKNGKIFGIDKYPINGVVSEHIRHFGLVSVSNLTHDRIVSNVKIQNIEIENNTKLSGRFAIGGKSYTENLIIENVKIKSGSEVVGGIGFEWCSDYYADYETPKPNLVNTPKNIILRNIIFDEVNYTNRDNKTLFFSAVYNVLVENVIIKKTNGVGIYISDGDWGFYDNDNYDNLYGGNSISFNNVQIHSSNRCVWLVNDGGLSKKPQPMNIALNNCSFIGMKSISNSLLSVDTGLYIFSWNNAKLYINSCLYINNEVGISFSTPRINNISIQNSEIRNNNTGLYAKSFELDENKIINNIKILNNRFIDNHYYEYSTSADILLEDVANICIDNNEFVRTVDSNKSFIRINPGSQKTKGVTITNNNFKSSGIASFDCIVGNGSIKTFLNLMRDNNTDGKLISGQRVIPIKKYSRLNKDDYSVSTLITEYVSSSKPADGVYNKGDICVVYDDVNDTIAKYIYNGTNWIISQ